MRREKGKGRMKREKGELRRENGKLRRENGERRNLQIIVENDADKQRYSHDSRIFLSPILNFHFSILLSPFSI